MPRYVSPIGTPHHCHSEWASAREGTPTCKQLSPRASTWVRVEGQRLGLLDRPIFPPKSRRAPRRSHRWRRCPRRCLAVFTGKPPELARTGIHCPQRRPNSMMVAMVASLCIVTMLSGCGQVDTQRRAYPGCPQIQSEERAHVHSGSNHGGLRNEGYRSLLSFRCVNSHPWG
jgi:hypothetical protein